MPCVAHCVRVFPWHTVLHNAVCAYEFIPGVGETCPVCVPCSHVHRVCHTLQQGLFLTQVLFLLHYTSRHMSHHIQAATYTMTPLTHLYTYTSKHKPRLICVYTYTHQPPPNFSSCLWGNLNNNSLCNNASNANPHQSEQRASCGSVASYAHQSHNRETGIQADCYVCLYVSISYNNMGTRCSQVSNPLGINLTLQ